MNQVGLRISPELHDWFIVWIDTKSSRYLVAEETATRQHYHIYMETAIGCDAVKKALSTQCKALGLVTQRGQENSYYGGVKMVDTDFIKYVLKEQAGKDTLRSKGFPPEDIQAGITAGAAQHAEVQARQGHSPDLSGSKPLPKKKIDLDQFCEKLLQDLNLYPGGTTDIADAYKMIGKAFLKSRLGRCDDRVSTPIIQSCMYRLFPHYIEDTFLERIHRNLKFVFPLH